MNHSPVPLPASRTKRIVLRFSAMNERRATTGLVLALTGLIAWESFLRGASPGPMRAPASAPALPAPVGPDLALSALPVSDALPSAPVVEAAQPAPLPADPSLPAGQPAPAAPIADVAPVAPVAPVAAVAPVSVEPAATGPVQVAVAPAPGPIPPVVAPVGGTAPLPSIAVAPPAAPGESAAIAPAAAERQAAMDRTVAMGGLLPANRILTYYGHPHDPNMGILGEYEKEELLQLLLAEAANYQAADPSRPVIPAFEVIATVAQNWPTDTGHYLLDTDLKTLQEYADFTEANGILLFLDLQIGRNTVPAEIAKVMPLLERPHVHLAIDPEFAIAEGQTPGTHIGEVTAAQITEAQQILARLVAERNLPPKVLIVHQFREDMILGKQELRPVDGVQVVIESDGFGSPALKKKVYSYIITEDEYEYSGIKHFYRQDVPVMTAAETLALDPSPILVIYQ